jgi:hypothetical protein
MSYISVKMNHFTNKLTSPLLSVCAGYVYIAVLATVLAAMGMYNKSTFFRWGTPVTFMGVIIDDNTTYYTLLLLFFVHQLINNWINSVTYPWIINCVQNPKSEVLIYSKKVTMLIVNMFALYSELDMILVVSGIISQAAFFVMIILANMISTTLINWMYIRQRKRIIYDDSDLEAGLTSYGFVYTP